MGILLGYSQISGVLETDLYLFLKIVSKYLLFLKAEFPKPTQYSTIKTGVIKVGLVFATYNFFSNKISHENKRMMF